MATTQYVVLPLDLKSWKKVVRTYQKLETAQRHCPERGFKIVEVIPED